MKLYSINLYKNEFNTEWISGGYNFPNAGGSGGFGTSPEDVVKNISKRLPKKEQFYFAVINNEKKEAISPLVGPYAYQDGHNLEKEVFEEILLGLKKEIPNMILI